MRSFSNDCVFDSVNSPIGPLTLLASNRGLHGVLFELQMTTSGEGFERFVEGPNHPVLLRSKSQLSEYLSGDRRDFDLPLAMGGTEFQRRVWDLLQQIPYGFTVTYGELARKLGGVSLARAVGAAVGLNPIAIIIPCHRVVGQNGALTGFAGGLDVKRTLLDLERDVSLKSP
jgi:methylated-DNA-[protein]-cysteine S-methyltransferase